MPKSTKPKTEPTPVVDRGAILRQAISVWRHNAAGPEYHADAMRVIHSSGKVTRMQYLESMYALEEKYPGRGWEREADALSQWFVKTLRKLDEIPKSAGLDVMAVIKNPPF